MSDYKTDQERFFAKWEEDTVERDRLELKRGLAAFTSEKVVSDLWDAAVAWAIHDGKTPLEAESFAASALAKALAATFGKLRGTKH